MPKRSLLCALAALAAALICAPSATAAPSLAVTTTFGPDGTPVVKITSTEAALVLSGTVGGGTWLPLTATTFTVPKGVTAISYARVVGRGYNALPGGFWVTSLTPISRTGTGRTVRFVTLSPNSGPL